MILSERRDGTLVRTSVENVVFSKAYDVIVSGLGTAGAPAAAMAAQNGLHVLGIEAFTCVGGTTTIGGIQGQYFGTPGGRYLAMDDEIFAFAAERARNKLESKKLVMEDILLRSGAEVLYESSICGVYLENDTVVGVRVITPDGVLDFASKVLMDCTGDAYTALIAGCETVYGRPLDGLAQPYSMVSTVRVDDRIRGTNCDFGRVDPADDRELSEALIFSRAYEMPEERSTGRFVMHMPLIGVREGHRIVAEEFVRLADVFAEKRTAEPMFYAYSDLDKHGWDVAFDGETLGDWTIGANLGAYNVTIPVPFKAIIPIKIDGMLVPCRALGVDQNVASCVRMVRDMKKTAEAAADLATLAIRKNCRLRDVPYAELKPMLVSSGCLDDAYDRGCRIDGKRNWNGEPLTQGDVTWITEPEKLEARLSTLQPGVAIWSAKRMGGKANETLRGLLTSADENTRKHAAFALAITGDASGVELLREMARERDPVMLHDCRKRNQQRGCMAVYFLGRLADAESVELLAEILTDPKEPERPAYNVAFARGTLYKIADFRNEYFQFFSNAFIALMRIADAHPELRERVAGIFRAAFEDGSYVKRITTRPAESSEGSMAANVRTVAYAAIARWEKE